MKGEPERTAASDIGDVRMKKQVTIRKMNIYDIEAVCGIEVLCFTDPWSREAFESELSGLNPCFYYVAECEGEICGYMGIWHIMDEGHITNVAVHPEYRNSGVGRLLVETTINEGIAAGLKAFTLEVRSSNDSAKHLYEKCGFESAGIRKRYYENREDAVIMWKYLQ